MTDTITFDTQALQDLHTLYSRLRRAGPVSRATLWDGVPVWLVTRYTDAKTLLADPRLSKDHARATELLPPNNDGSYVAPINAGMLHQDPPDHSRLRKLVQKAFTPGATERLTSRVIGIADELLDAVQHDVSQGPVDLIRAYAAPLPIRVISQLLGIPRYSFDEFETAADTILAQSRREAKAAATAKIGDLLLELFEQKRRRPADDLLSRLVQASDDGDRLTEDELLATAFLLILAGYETTMNLIGNSVVALLRNPTQLAALRADRSLLPNAVEEFLRFDGPGNVATLRFTTVPIEIGDTRIPADEFVIISLLAANRDSDQFAKADQLDITRKPNGHLAFGHGIHYCLGAPLARLEGQIAIDRLLTRFSEITLDSTAPLEYRDSSLMHGLTALPVHLST